MSRVDAAYIAARKGSEHAGTAPCVVASDAFFPFADGLLTDYQVVINITTDEEVANMIDKRTLVNLEGIESNAESIGMMCSLIKAIEENDLTHIITYHSRVKQAEILSQDLQKIFTLTDSKYKSEPPVIRHVSGEMLTTQRTRIIKTFRINCIN